MTGHGTQLDDLMEIEPRQWLEQIDALVSAAQAGPKVVVAGLVGIHPGVGQTAIVRLRR